MGPWQPEWAEWNAETKPEMPIVACCFMPEPHIVFNMKIAADGGGRGGGGGGGGGGARGKEVVQPFQLHCISGDDEKVNSKKSFFFFVQFFYV